MIQVMVVVVIFFFKQKTAYEMRISDWSSDVCSSDLWKLPRSGEGVRLHERRFHPHDGRTAHPCGAGDLGLSDRTRRNLSRHLRRLVCRSGRGVLCGERTPRWAGGQQNRPRSEEHTSDLPSLMRTSYAFFCLTSTRCLCHQTQTTR